MSHADPSKWPMIRLLGSWLHIWVWVSPCVTQWRTERPVPSACGALGGVSLPQQVQCCSAGLLSPSSTVGQEVWRGSDSWRSSLGWPAVPLWLTTCHWWQEPQECLSVRKISYCMFYYCCVVHQRQIIILQKHSSKSTKAIIVDHLSHIDSIFM